MYDHGQPNSYRVENNNSRVKVDCFLDLAVHQTCSQTLLLYNNVTFAIISIATKALSLQFKHMLFWAIFLCNNLCCYFY